MPSTTPIPLELLERVINSVDQTNNGSILAALAQTCRAAYPIAIARLYAHVRLHSDRQFSCFFEGLSIPADEQGNILPCDSHTVEVPIAEHNKCPNNTVRATRKLSHFLNTRHLTLEFIPSLAVYPSNVFGDKGSSGIAACVDVDGRSRRLSPLLPHCYSLALGKGFIRDLVGRLIRYHVGPMPCNDPEHERDNEWWFQDFGWGRTLYPLLKASHPDSLKGLSRISDVLGWIYPICFDIDEIPTDLCGALQQQVVEALTSKRVWRTSIGTRQTHSTFPGTSLAPWTCVRDPWCHFITVRRPSASPAAISPSTGHAEDPSHNVGSGDEHARHQDSDGSLSSILDKLAEDVYSIASETLECVAYSEKPRRRSIIVSGLREEEVRDLEQRFVRVVKRRFDDPDDVIVDPSLSLRPCPERDGDEADDDQSDEDDSDSDSDWDPNDNLYRDDEAGNGRMCHAVRDYQKRVLMFDFYHASSTWTCEGCGAGEGLRRGASRVEDMDGFDVYLE